MKHQPSNEPLTIDLSGLQIEEIEVFLQESSKGLPEFAASCATCCYCCSGSCSEDVSDE